MPYHASMNDLKRAAEAEAEARKRFNAAYRKLEQEGVGGEDSLNRLQPRYEEYQQKRFERMVEERDVKMLRRGTYRGIAIAAGILFVFWTVQAGTPLGGRYIFGVLALSCLYLVWRLGRIPLLGHEQDIDD